MRSSMRALLPAPALTAVIIAALSGCGGEMSMKMRLEGPVQMQIQGPMIFFEGMYISESLYDRVTPGETSEPMVMALFGEPTEEHLMPDGTLVWKWIYREHGFDTTMFTVVGDKEEKQPSQPQQITFVRLREGVVVEKWRS